MHDYRNLAEVSGGHPHRADKVHGRIAAGPVGTPLRADEDDGLAEVAEHEAQRRSGVSERVGSMGYHNPVLPVVEEFSNLVGYPPPVLRLHVLAHYVEEQLRRYVGYLEDLGNGLRKLLRGESGVNGPGFVVYPACDSSSGSKDGHVGEFGLLQKDFGEAHLSPRPGLLDYLDVGNRINEYPDVVAVVELYCEGFAAGKLIGVHDDSFVDALTPVLFSDNSDIIAYFEVSLLHEPLNLAHRPPSVLR